LQFEINKQNVMDLFATHARIMKLDQGAESKVDDRASLESHVQAMIDSMPFIVDEERVSTDAKRVGRSTVAAHD
jgi:hypothetical protein